MFPCCYCTAQSFSTRFKYCYRFRFMFYFKKLASKTRSVLPLSPGAYLICIRLSFNNQAFALSLRWLLTHVDSIFVAYCLEHCYQRQRKNCKDSVLQFTGHWTQHNQQCHRHWSQLDVWILHCKAIIHSFQKQVFPYLHSSYFTTLISILNYKYCK